MNWLRSLFARKPKQPKVWAVRPFGSWTWTKVVSYDPPGFLMQFVGPFRSEVDCEEFCISQNKLEVPVIKVVRKANPQ